MNTINPLKLYKHIIPYSGRVLINLVFLVLCIDVAHCKDSELKSSLKQIGSDYFIGQDLFVELKIDNSTEEILSVIGLEKGYILRWMHENRNKLKLKKNNIMVRKTIIPQKTYTAFSRIKPKMISIKPKEFKLFKINLRAIFNFNVNEAGKYELIINDAKLHFEIKENPNTILRKVRKSKESRYNEGVGYIVKKEKSNFKLFGRWFNKTFIKLTSFDEKPNSIDVIWSERGDGYFVIVSFSNKIGILSPIESYLGEIKDYTRKLIFIEMKEIVKLNKMSIADLKKLNQSVVFIEFVQKKEKDSKKASRLYFSWNRKLTKLTETQYFDRIKKNEILVQDELRKIKKKKESEKTKQAPLSEAERKRLIRLLKEKANE